MEEKEFFPLWTCQLSSVEEISGSNGFSVGDLRSLKCSGESSGLENGKPPVFIYSQADQKYIIKKVDTIAVADNEAEFLVASYRPGEYSNIDLLVTNGLSGFRIENLTINTKSILTKEIKEPFPSLGPYILKFPKEYSIGLLVVGLFLAIVVFRKMYFFLKRREFRKILKRKYTPLSAYNEFAKSLRKWRHEPIDDGNTERKYKEIEGLWLEYLENSFYLPKELSLKKALSLFKKENKTLHSLYGSDLKACYLELLSAHKNTKQLTVDGMNRLYKQLQSLSGNFYNFYRQGEK